MTLKEQFKRTSRLGCLTETMNYYKCEKYPIARITLDNSNAFQRDASDKL